MGALSISRKLCSRSEQGFDRRGTTRFTSEERQTLTDHHFYLYLYRGYLQIAALDMKTSGDSALWYTHWDPTEPIATRPLSIRKNSTWYTFGHDLTKNITELYKTDGTIASTYDYTPYGAVTTAGIDQPFQWSSEVYDAELGMVYYNYRHYNPMDGRWIGRDSIEEEGGINLYSFVKNSLLVDYLGLKGNPPTWNNYPWLPTNNQQAIDSQPKSQLKEQLLNMGTNNGCELLCWLAGQGLSSGTLFPIPPGADMDDLLNGRLQPPSGSVGPNGLEKPTEPSPSGITGSINGSITGNTGSLFSGNGLEGKIGGGIGLNGKLSGTGDLTRTSGKNPNIKIEVGIKVDIPTSRNSNIYVGGSVNYNSQNGWRASVNVGWRINF